MSTLAHHPPNSQHQHSKSHSSDHNPRGVSSRVSGLYFASLPANSTCHSRDAVYRAVDDAFVHHVPEHVCRNPKKRTNNQRGIYFVHIIFIEQKFVETVRALGKFLWRVRLAYVKPPSHQQSDNREHYRRPGQSVK